MSVCEEGLRLFLLSGSRVSPAGVEPADQAVSGGHSAVLAPDDPRHQHQGGSSHHHRNRGRLVVRLGADRQVKLELCKHFRVDLHAWLSCGGFLQFNHRCGVLCKQAFV